MGAKITANTGTRSARHGVSTAVVGVVGVLGTAIVLVLLLQLIGFRPDRALRLGLAAVPVVAVVFLFMGAVYHRFRFSMKALLLFYLLCGCGLTLVVRQNVAWHAEEQAVEQLLRSQARLVRGEPTKPPWLSELLGDEYVAEGPLTHVSLIPSNTFFITDSMLKPLARFPTLRSLDVFAPKLTDAGLEAIRGLTRLERISLGGVPLTDAGLKRLAHLSNLRELRLDSTRMTDAGLKHLANLKRLEILVLDGSGITDRGLEHLGDLLRLKEISLKDTLVTDDGVALLREKLPQATLVTGSSTPRSQRVAVERIRELGGYIRVSNQNKATTVSFAINGGCDVDNDALLLLEQLPDLETVELGNNPAVTDQGLKHLAKLTKLRTLYLHDTTVRGPGLKHLAGLPNLEFLQLQGTPMTHEGVVHLRNLKSLKWANLENTLVSDDAVQELQAALPQCEIVY